MKILFLVLVLATSIMAQQRQWPSHDHENSQHRKRGEPRRVKRTTPAIAITGTDPRLYNQLNDCGQIFRGFESPERLRRMEREKRDCLREARNKRR
jgi:hypothetical protein